MIRFFPRTTRLLSWIGLLLIVAACEAPRDVRRTNFNIEKPGLTMRYDAKTGRLRKIELDLNKNGRTDTWSYWDGTSLSAIEIDQDEDGKIDRWEHYDGRSLMKVTKIGSSSRDDGVEDTWTYPDEFGLLAKVETDTDRDGAIDKRERYVARKGPSGRVLFVVEQGIDKSGEPARRFYYRPDGTFDRAETTRP